jgi:hypothetical protein
MQALRSGLMWVARWDHLPSFRLLAVVFPCTLRSSASERTCTRPGTTRVPTGLGHRSKRSAYSWSPFFETNESVNHGVVGDNARLTQESNLRCQVLIRDVVPGIPTAYVGGASLFDEVCRPVYRLINA